MSEREQLEQSIDLPLLKRTLFPAQTWQAARSTVHYQGKEVQYDTS